jgi:CheY-like chemotaxis protein
MSAIQLGINRADSMRSLFRWLAPAPKPKPAVAQVVLPAPVPSRGKKILIVDDDALILKTVAMKLKGEGYATVTAADGAEAIRAARREKPDVILLDLSFPADVGGVAWDGFLIMAWLRRLEEAQNIPIIVISASDPAKYEQRFLSAGATAFFNKPIAFENLLPAIDRTIGPEAGKRSPRTSGDFQI